MLILRPTSIEEAKIITDIKARAYNDETRRFGPGRDGGPMGYDSLKENQRIITLFENYSIILDKQIIGCFWIHPIEEATAELEDFCIDPKYHNKGYGYEVLKLLETLEERYKRWVLTTPYYSVRNQYLYEKVGFKKIGMLENDFLVLYEKVLD